jgi:hypothetical protein
MSLRRAAAHCSLFAAAIAGFGVGSACAGRVAAGGSEGADGATSDAGTACAPGDEDGAVRLESLDGDVVWVGVDDGRVYFSVYEQAVESLPATGGAPSQVAPASATGGYYGEFVFSGVAFDGSYVYWSEGVGGGASAIERAPLGGGAPEPVVASQGFLAGIAIAAGTLYGVNQVLGEVFAMPVTGGTPAVIASGLTTPAGIAVHGGVVYVSDAASDLLSVPVDGGAVTTLVKGPGLPPNVEVADFSPGMAADDDYVYFSQYYASSPVLAKVSRLDGTMTVLAPGSAAGIAVDATDVYWVTAPGDTTSVNAVPIAGGPVRVLAANQPLAVGPALDDCHVYWATAVGATCVGCPPAPGSNAIFRTSK